MLLNSSFRALVTPPKPLAPYEVQNLCHLQESGGYNSALVGAFSINAPSPAKYYLEVDIFAYDCLHPAGTVFLDHHGRVWPHQGMVLLNFKAKRRAVLALIGRAIREVYCLFRREADPPGVPFHKNLGGYAGLKMSFLPEEWKGIQIKRGLHKFREAKKAAEARKRLLLAATRKIDGPNRYS